MTYYAQQEALKNVIHNIPAELTAHAVVCEFSAEDDTPTLHLDLWRGMDLHDLPEFTTRLTIAAEGHWDGGRTYSLQVAL
jgi:hypothetical protein